MTAANELPEACRRPAVSARWPSACLLALLLAPAAQAVLVAGPGGSAEQGRRIVLPSPAEPAASTPALDLVAARLDAVNVAAGRVVVNGRSVTLHPSALRVIGPGGQALGGAAALSAGQQVRFALEPGTAAERRIVLVFIDR